MSDRSTLSSLFTLIVGVVAAILLIALQPEPVTRRPPCATDTPCITLPPTAAAPCGTTERSTALCPAAQRGSKS